jgi:hypothetical protein
VTSFDIRLPNISGTTEREQLAQIRTYLFGLAEQLRWALNVDNSEGMVVYGTGDGGASSGSGASGGTDIDTTKIFTNLKDLIISSGEIIEAYTAAITRSLEGKYVLASDFGQYVNETSALIEANSTGLALLLQSFQQVISDNGDDSICVTANIRAGLLDYDSQSTPIYGLEVGQKNGNDFRRYARFTADELAFFDGNDIKVAWISGYTMHITNAEILGNLKLGKFIIKTTNGLALKYIG